MDTAAYTTTALCFVGGLIILLLVLLANAIRIVPEYQRLVVFRLGRCVGARGPGIVFLIPVIDRAVKVDLREQVREIPHQTSITKDNAPISVDFLWYYKVLDPTESILQVGNFEVSRPGHGHHHPAGGDRRHPAGRRAVGARAHQQYAAHTAGRSDGALGCEGDERRDPRDHPAARGAGRDEPADVGGAHPAGGGDRVRPERARRR